MTQNNESENTSNTEVLPGIGATYQLIPEAQLYGGVYRAFSPASNGVALDGLVDQKLDGERSVNYELGIRGTVDRVTYELTGFYMKVRLPESLVRTVTIGYPTWMVSVMTKLLTQKRRSPEIGSGPALATPRSTAV